jgi:hypothetical protein
LAEEKETVAGATETEEKARARVVVALAAWEAAVGKSAAIRSRGAESGRR